MIIIHRCSCGCPDIYHREAGPCENCTAVNHRPGPSELMPTFVDRQVQAYVHEPGTAWYNDKKLCGCDTCRALYKDVKVNVAPLRSWYIRDPQPATPKKRGTKPGGAEPASLRR